MSASSIALRCANSDSSSVTGARCLPKSLTSYVERPFSHDRSRHRRMVAHPATRVRLDACSTVAPLGAASTMGNPMASPAWSLVNGADRRRSRDARHGANHGATVDTPRRCPATVTNGPVSGAVPRASYAAASASVRRVVPRSRDTRVPCRNRTTVRIRDSRRCSRSHGGISPLTSTVPWDRAAARCQRTSRSMWPAAFARASRPVFRMSRFPPVSHGTGRQGP